MKVILENKDGREIDFSGTVSALLKDLKIDSESVLVIRDSEVITEEEDLDNSDTIKIISVISGG